MVQDETRSGCRQNQLPEQLQETDKQNQALDQLKMSEEILREIQQIALIGRWELNHSTGDLHWSDTIFQIFEKDPEVFAATYEGFIEAVHPEDRDKVNKAFQDSLLNQSPYEITHRLLFGDGRIKWVYEKCKSWFDKSGHPLVSVGIVQDISALKEVEGALREQQRYLRTILETTKDGFWVVNREGRITDVNLAYCHMSGYTAKELLTMCIGDLDVIETPEVTRNRMRRIFEKGSEIFETRHRKKDGSIFDVEVSVSCSDPTIGELVCFCRDITARKQLEKSLRLAIKRAELANDAKSRYLAHMNHEIRTPLNGFMGFMSLMEDTGLNEEQREYIFHMKQSTSHMLSIINNVLDHAKIEAGQMKLANQSFYLDDEVRSAMVPLQSLARQQHLVLELTLGKDLPLKVVGDSQRLRQIILNLAGNAVKFTRKGVVRVTLTCLETSESRHTLKLVVEDTGPGMNREIMDKLFQPFYQADDGSTPQNQGTGLGLTITHELVELMNGKIMVESWPGKGTRVEVALNLGRDRDVDSGGLAEDRAAEISRHDIERGED